MSARFTGYLSRTHMTSFQSGRWCDLHTCGSVARYWKSCVSMAVSHGVKNWSDQSAIVVSVHARRLLQHRNRSHRRPALQRATVTIIVQPVPPAGSSYDLPIATQGRTS